MVHRDCNGEGCRNDRGEPDESRGASARPLYTNATGPDYQGQTDFSFDNP